MLEYKPNFGGAAAILQAAAQVIAVAERERLERLACPDWRERMAAALEALEDNDVQAATVILKTALGVKVPDGGQQ